MRKDLKNLHRLPILFSRMAVFTLMMTSLTALQAQTREGESALYYPLGLTETFLTPSTALNLTDAMTIEAWIKPDGWGEGPNYIGTIFQKPSIWLFIVKQHSTANDSSLILQLRHATGVSHAFAETGSIVLNEWSHIAVSYDGSSNAVHMTINGHPQEVSYISTPVGPIRNNASESIYVGSVAGGIMGFMGTMDELRIWNVARSQAELEQYMGSYLEGHQPGLQAYWPMNEGGGNIINDMSGNGHNINLAGVEWTYGTPFHPTYIHEPGDKGLFPEMELQAYPNPFNPDLMIRSSLPYTSDLHIRIYNALGQEVWSQTHLEHPPGDVQFHWPGVNHSGGSVPSGIYLISLASQGQATTTKSLLLR